MMDLLCSLVFAPMSTSTQAPASPDQTPATLVSCDVVTPRPVWKDPYYPSKGRSPLRNEYFVPGAWPGETVCEEGDMYNTGSVPTTLEQPSADMSAGVETSSPPSTHDSLSGDSPSMQSLSSPPPSPPLDPGDEKEGESEDTVEYNPEHAPSLTARALSQHERQQRRNNEDLHRIRNAEYKQWDWETHTRQWMLENMLCKDVRRACKGLDRTLKVYVRMELRRMGGWERDGDVGGRFGRGKGTPGHVGHRRLRGFFCDMVKKRKREGRGGWWES